LAVLVIHLLSPMKPEPAAQPSGGGRHRRRSVAEIKAELDAITAEFERLHGRPLLDNQQSRRRQDRDERKERTA